MEFNWNSLAGIELLRKMELEVDTGDYPNCPKCNDKCSHLEKGKHIYTEKDNCCKCNAILDNLFISCGLHL